LTQHLPCPSPDCNSSDGYSIQDNGWGHCSTCDTLKPLNEFYTSGVRYHKQRYMKKCKQCSRKQPTLCKFCSSELSKRKSGACDTCYPAYRKAENLFAAARWRANNKSLPFDLTIPFIFEHLQRPCPKTGKSFNLGKSGSSYSDRDLYCPSVDKINPYLGYTQDNVQIVCWGYNVAKQRFTDEEIIEFWKSTVDYLARAESQPTHIPSKTTDGAVASGSAEEGTFLQ
jgi:hypothetical protein